MLVQITHWHQAGKQSLFKYSSTLTQTVAKAEDNMPAVSVVCSSALEFLKGIKRHKNFSSMAVN